MSILIGKILLSQFRVDAFVAAGGMGSVYRVWDLKRNVPLAMKVLHSDLAEDPSMFKHFQREARALQKLAHPNIVPFYGLYNNMDFVFMLEHFVDGPSMKEALKRSRGKPLPIHEVLVYLKALCSALGYAHANGVVHCDVKPGNVMIDSTGHIYLTDFGIARHADSAITTIGPTGTSAYMPPEQILGKPVSPATDVYALGIILYEMLTGRRPFIGSASETASDKSSSTMSLRIRQEQLHKQAQDPQEINPAISVELAKVALKALDKKSARRYENATQFFAAVCDAVSISPMSISDRAVLSSTAMQKHDNPMRNIGVSENKRFPLIPVLIGVAGIAVVGCIVMAFAAGAVLWSGSSTTYAAPSSYQAEVIQPTQSVRASTPRPKPTDNPAPLVVEATQPIYFTPTIPPMPTEAFCSNLQLNQETRTKGVYLTVCYESGEYEIGPLAKGAFEAGPNQAFFVYITSLGEVYGSHIGDPTFILIGKIKTFTAINKHDEAQFSISFSSGPPYDVYIQELIYNDSTSFSINPRITTP